MAGRDRELAELRVRFRACRWELVGVTSREELEEREVPDDVLRVLDFMAWRASGWQGTATDLLAAVGAGGVTVAAFGKHLAQHAGFMLYRGVAYSRAPRELSCRSGDRHGGRWPRCPPTSRAGISRRIQQTIGRGLPW